MKAKELDKIFDSGKDFLKHLDLSTAKRKGLEPQRVNVDFPQWMIQALDHQAQLLGVTRQSVIKIWIAERLKEEIQ